MTTHHGAARVLLGLFALVAQRANADGDYISPTDDRVRLSLGAMHVSNSTNVRVDNSTGAQQGTDINGESTFALDRTDFEPKFQATVRVATRQRLSFDYFSLDRSGDTTLAGSAGVLFRNVILIPGDPLQTKLSLRTLGLTYGYSFWHSETLELAATLGVHDTDVSAMVKVQSATRHIIQTEDAAGPVPTVGFDGTWVASRRFYFDGRAQYLDVHAGNIQGSLGIYEFDVLYRYRPNVSLAVGYTDIDAHLASVKRSQSGLFDFKTKGPEVFLRVAF